MEGRRLRPEPEEHCMPRPITDRDWGALQGAIAGEVVLPGSPGYELARKPPIAARSGGHCFAGNSSTQGIVIDVTPMRSVSVRDGVATVGAGARLGDLYDALAAHDLTIPAGCGPTVGIAGLVLGGGRRSRLGGAGARLLPRDQAVPGRARP